MKKKTVTIALLLFLLLAIVAGIFGIRRIGSRAKQAEAETMLSLAGQYELSSMEGDSDQLIPEDVLELLTWQGMGATLDISFDGTGDMDLFGNRYALTFDAKEMRVEIDGKSWPFSLQNGELRIEQEDSELIFVLQEDAAGDAGLQAQATKSPAQ